MIRSVLLWVQKGHQVLALADTQTAGGEMSHSLLENHRCTLLKRPAGGDITGFTTHLTICGLRENIDLFSLLVRFIASEETFMVI